MADFEDCLTPTWDNIMKCHKNLSLATNDNINYFDGKSKKEYKVNSESSTHIFARVRGLHKQESHVDAEGQPMSAALFDLGVYLWHSHEALFKTQGGAFITIPKVQTVQEAELWSEIFSAIEDYLDYSPHELIKCSVVVESI